MLESGNATSRAYDARLEEFRDLQAAIDSEYRLNDGRKNFLLLLHTVIFGLLGIASASNPVYIVFIALAGLVSAAVSGLSIFAGVARIVDLKRLREAEFSDMSLRMQLGAPLGSWQHKLGVMPYQVYPSGLFVTWWAIFAYSL